MTLVIDLGAKYARTH